MKEIPDCNRLKINVGVVYFSRRVNRDRTKCKALRDSDWFRVVPWQYRVVGVYIAWVGVTVGAIFD